MSYFVLRTRPPPRSTRTDNVFPDTALCGSDLEQREREASGIPTLKVGYNRVHGYYLEISKAHAAKAPTHYTRRQTLTNAERYITEERSEEHTSELQSLMRISYAVFCLKQHTPLH